MSTAAAAAATPDDGTARPSVVVLDYGFGNIRSAQRALELAGADVTVTAEWAAALEADGLVVPGVGAFAACMEGLDRVKAGKLIDQRLVAGRPVLGICVGFQVMFDDGVEFAAEPTEGLGQWPGRVERLTAPILPHMGWNTVQPGPGSELFAGLEGERFYFVHSFGVHDFDMTANAVMHAPVVTWAEHGGDRFVAAVENGPLCATQFHPEKSGDAGAALLRTWVRRLPAAGSLTRVSRW